MRVPNSQKATRTWASALRKTLAILARQAGVPGIGRSPDEDGDGLILVWPSCLRSMLWERRHVMAGWRSGVERSSWLARVTSVYDKPDPECDLVADSRPPHGGDQLRVEPLTRTGLEGLLRDLGRTHSMPCTPPQSAPSRELYSRGPGYIVIAIKLVICSCPSSWSLVLACQQQAQRTLERVIQS